MKKKILNHFEKSDPILFGAIDEDIRLFSVSTKKKIPHEYFASLCRSIVSQQLSGKAASSIHKRFVALFPKETVTPKKLLKETEHSLRNVGMSYAKARTLLDHAEKVQGKLITYKNIEDRTNEEVKEMLLQIKGVGPWTCEMFLMFSLGRSDVFAPKDLGLQKGVQLLYNLKKRPTEKEMENISKKWTPYRTYASVILWHTVDTK